MRIQLNHIREIQLANIPLKTLAKLTRIMDRCLKNKGKIVEFIWWAPMILTKRSITSKQANHRCNWRTSS